jgi:hypothetical protein
MAEYFSLVESSAEDDEAAEVSYVGEDPGTQGTGGTAGSGAGGGGTARAKKKAKRKDRAEAEKSATGSAAAGSADSAASQDEQDEMTRILERAQQELGRRQQEDGGGEQPQGRKEKKQKKRKKQAPREPGGAGNPEYGAGAQPGAESGAAAEPTGGGPADRMGYFILEAAGVKSARDLKQLMQPAVGLDRLVSLLLMLALSLLMLLQPALPAVIASALAEQFGRQVEAAFFSNTIIAFGGFLLLWTLQRTYRFGLLIQRRRQFLRMLNRAESMGLASRDEMREYVARRFGLSRRLF